MGHTSHALQLAPEVLLHIMEHLPENAVAASAITCQAWKDPALDVLWREIDLRHLLSVLAPLEEKDDELHFTHSVTREAWARFHSLAPRVWKGWLHYDLHSSLVAEVYVTNPSPPPLLSSVLSLEVQTEVNGHGLLFMGPQLQKLSLNLPDLRNEDGRIQKRLFDRIPSVSSMINRLDLLVECADTNTVNSIADMLQQQPGLQYVTLSIWDVQDIRPIGVALASLPRLRELDLTTHATAIFQNISAVSTPFCTLRRLIVYADDGAELPALLDSMSSQTQLTHLYYGSPSDTTEVDVRQICVGAGQHEKLQSLSLKTLLDTTPLSPDIVTPLHGLSALSTLEIDYRGPVLLTDNDIHHLGSRLPLLRTLKLDGINEMFNMSLKAYELIVILCPVIETLSLPVNATTPASLEVIRASSTLRLINVQNSPIDDSQAVALFLSRLSDVDNFAVSTWTHSEDVQTKKWEEVEAWLPVLRKVAVYQGKKMESQAGRG